MFLILKNNHKIFLALESSDSVVSTMYASLKEEYKDIEMDIVFDKPACEVERNLVRFISFINGESDVRQTPQSAMKETVVERVIERPTSGRIRTAIETLSIDERAIDSSVSVDISEKKEEILKVEEVKPTARETIKLEVEEIPPREIIKPVVKESLQIEEVEPVVVKRVDPAERTLEKIREQQRQEGLPKLDNKVNTLEYRKYLENFMKLGFTASVLNKKAADMTDRELKGKMNEVCERSMARVENYEEKFRAAGLTTAQIHTFRMEALREVKKYRDSSYEEVFKYLRKLYDLSEELIKELN